MSQTSFQLLLQELGDDVSSDENGLVSLLLDGEVIVDLEYNEESGLIVLSSLLGTISESQKEELYPDLLEANLCWSGTAGGTLGVDPITSSLFLCYQEYLGRMELKDFQEVVQQFGNAALYWKKRIEEKKD